MPKGVILGPGTDLAKAAEVAKGTGLELPPDVAAERQQMPEVLGYPGGMVRLANEGKLLLWRRSPEHPEVCVELLIGCMIETDKKLRESQHPKNGQLRLCKKDTEALLEKMDIVLGRTGPFSPEGVAEAQKKAEEETGDKEEGS